MAMQCASLRGVALLKVKTLDKHILFDKHYKTDGLRNFISLEQSNLSHVLQNSIFSLY